MIHGSCSKNWAQLVEIEGVPNLWRVAPTLYRSAQPSIAGFVHLLNLNFDMVINLRAFTKDPRVPFLQQEHISFKTWHPEEEDVRKFLSLVAAPGYGFRKTLVHCRHGADRTGTMIAFYRIFKQNWGVEEAIDEMVRGGFGYHAIWGHLPGFIRRMARKIGKIY
jgi:protein tyrosine/serine phosphatase